MRIYTKSGDAGETGLVGNARIPKDSLRIAAIGAVDELNASIGLARCEAAGTGLEADLSRIQNWLFDLGAELATMPGAKFKDEYVTEKQVSYLETSMDSLAENLPLLRNFILPGGCRLASHLHFARCVCRRAEREVLALHRLEPVRDEARRFLNRLSDWIFLASRTANRVMSVEDIVWKNPEE